MVNPMMVSAANSDPSRKESLALLVAVIGSVAYRLSAIVSEPAVTLRADAPDERSVQSISDHRKEV